MEGGGAHVCPTMLGLGGQGAAYSEAHLQRRGFLFCPK